MTLAKASLSCDPSFTVLVTAITIVNYDRKTFIVHTTGVFATKRHSALCLILRARAGAFLSGMRQSVHANRDPRGCIFSCVRPFYELTVSNIDRSMHMSLSV
jgi:hypothetical protein